MKKPAIATAPAPLPIRHDLYGIPEQPRFAFYPFEDSRLHRNTRHHGAHGLAPIGHRAVVGYFRLLPYALFKHNLQAVMQQRQAALHVLLSSLGDRSRATAHRGHFAQDALSSLSQSRPHHGRLAKLLKDFRWDRVDQVYPITSADGGAMTALRFLCHRLPFPPNKGDKIRSHALLKHLAERGPVHVGLLYRRS